MYLIKIICMQYYDLILIEKLHGIFVLLKMDCHTAGIIKREKGA